MGSWSVLLYPWSEVEAAVCGGGAATDFLHTSLTVSVSGTANLADLTMPMGRISVDNAW